MSERISVSTKEFQAFLAENQRMTERYEKMLNRLTDLDRLNRELGAKQRQTAEKLNLMEQRIEVDVQKGDETLRRARDHMARLMKETETRLTGL